MNETFVLQKRFVYGPGIDEPVCMINYPSETVYFYHYDGQGNVTTLSDENGDVVEMYKYDVYGVATIYTAAGTDGVWLTSDDTMADASAVGNPYLFTGRQYDSGTGLYYYRARMYSPQLGRFLQPDPIGYADSMNLYAYCGNNPVNFLDPWGLCKEEPLFDENRKVNPNRIGPDGIVEITDKDLKQEIAHHMGTRLNRAKEVGELIGSTGDTRFFDNSDRRFRYKGKVYSGSQVNYIGVGQGFRYFGLGVASTYFGPHIWNRYIAPYGHWATNEEIYFAYYGWRYHRWYRPGWIDLPF